MRVLILHAPGTNRDPEAVEAFRLAGAEAEVVPLTRLRSGTCKLRDYGILMVPGGFSYGDALGAGRLLALDLEHYFRDQVAEFIASGRPVLGVCNGFQALVRSGLLPGTGPATLTFNAWGRFECRWVTLMPRPGQCLWTCDLQEPIDCPVAHGEGNFQPGPETEVNVALVYTRADLHPALDSYPANPNGSWYDTAGICNPAGNVLGLMPHPEDHLYPHQHPLYPRGFRGRLGLPLFQAGVAYARG